MYSRSVLRGMSRKSLLVRALCELYQQVFQTGNDWEEEQIRYTCWFYNVNSLSHSQEALCLPFVDSNEPYNRGEGTCLLAVVLPPFKVAVLFARDQGWETWWKR